MNSVAKWLLPMVKKEVIDKHQISPDHSISYQTAVKKVFTELRSSNTLSQIRKIFTEFETHFTMFPELWRLWLE